MRRATVTIALVAAALLAGGCGTQAADLFVLTRDGQGPGAHVRLLVVDDGTVQCDGGKSRELPSSTLLDARQLQREVAPDARRHRRYPPRPGSILRYRLRSQDGTVAWADTSRPLPERYDQLAFLVRRVSKDVCGNAR
jgi:hypothetical protein